MGDGSFDPVVHGCEGVFHITSPASLEATDPQEMARFRTTARKSVAPVPVQVVIPYDIYQPRTRAQVAIRMKQLIIENKDRTIRKLRANNYKRRHQLECCTKELIEEQQARVKDKVKLEEAWTIIMQLSENNQRLTKEVEKGKAKKKKLKEKHNACHIKTRNLLDIADNEIQALLNDITKLKLEKQNLQWQIEDLLDPEEHKEDPEEEEEALPIEVVGDGELSD